MINILNAASAGMQDQSGEEGNGNHKQPLDFDVEKKIL